MKTRAWTSVAGGLLCLAFLGCSASSTDGKGKVDNPGAGATGSGGITLGGNGPGPGGGSAPPLGGGVDGGGNGNVCSTGSVEFVPKVPTVMLMVDRSGTMFVNQGNPWGTLRDGVLPVVKDLNDKVRFGFMAITGEAGTCPLVDEVPPADANYEAVQTKYMSLVAPTKGESPGMLGLQQAYDTLSKDPTPGDKYIVFVTDGEQDYCGDGNALCPTDSVVYWLQKLKALGVTTLVFGLPSSGDQAAYANILQAFANAGAGQAVAPAVGAGQTQLDIFNQCFYGGDANAAGWKLEYAAAEHPVDDPATTAVNESQVPLGVYAAAGGTAKVYKPDPADPLALAEEFRKVLSGVKSCTFDLGGDIKVVQKLLSEAHVYIEGVEVPLDLTMVSGWYMPTPTQIELVGAACDTWRTPENNKIVWDFPCNILEPK
jgi:hypothetical protein